MDLQDTLIRILTKSVSRKMGFGVHFETSDQEDTFFKELIKCSLNEKLNPLCFYFEPMSNKSFSVQYNNYPIGKIKLSGRKTYMQILKGLHTVKRFEGLSLEEYISHIPEWIMQIKYCTK